MSNCVEIRWHGRGGQGAKTAALLLADVAFQTGKHVQGFPEYGPERMGAPITAYNRISDEAVRVHSNIYDPEYVVVVDETLLETVDVTNGLKKEGAIVINTEKPKEEIIPHLKGYEGDVYTIDAKKVSLACLGKYFPNTPMLAAIVKVSGISYHTIDGNPAVFCFFCIKWTGGYGLYSGRIGTQFDERRDRCICSRCKIVDGNVFVRACADVGRIICSGFEPPSGCSGTRKPCIIRTDQYQL